MAELLLLADRVGFEPTSLLRDYLISSQGRSYFILYKSLDKFIGLRYTVGKI